MEERYALDGQGPNVLAFDSVLDLTSLDNSKIAVLSHFDSRPRRRRIARERQLTLNAINLGPGRINLTGLFGVLGDEAYPEFGGSTPRMPH